MFRTPFVWEIHVRREVVEDEIARLRELPHSVWREVLGRPLNRIARGRDNRAYRLRTTADWTHSGSDDIRVCVSLHSRALRRKLHSQSFVITPENSFKD